MSIVRPDPTGRERIQAAKKARDHIVHRGSYQPNGGAKNDLHEHLLTTRELVVRFVLSALQFDGQYWSYLGGYHPQQFVKGVLIAETK